MGVGWRRWAAVVVVAALASGALLGSAGAQTVPGADDPATGLDPVAPEGPPLELTVPEGWLPSPMPAPSVPSVAFIGDSIGRDAQTYVRNQVRRTHPVAYYHSVAAGYIGYHLHHTRLLSVLRSPTGPDILLVELGTGDAFWDHGSAKFERDVRRFLDTVLNLAPNGTPQGPPLVTCVRWFDQKPTANIAYPYVNEHRVAFNRILGRVLAEPRYAQRNVALVSYSAWYWLSGDQGYFLADRLHHTQAGRRELGLLAGQAAEGCDPAFTSGPFWDVPDRSRSAEAIGWLGDNGVAQPYRNGAYRAQLGSLPVPLDRTQFAELLWRLAGSPTDLPLSTWRDVPASVRRPVGWVQAKGIMRGYADGTFRGSGLVTREALAMYLWRAMAQPTEGVTPLPWPDVAPGFRPAVDWAVATGVLAPYPSGAFGSGVTVTRALAARSLYALGLLDATIEAADATTSTTGIPATTAPPPPATLAPTVPSAPTTVPPAPTTITTDVVSGAAERRAGPDRLAPYSSPSAAPRRPRLTLPMELRGSASTSTTVLGRL